MPCITRFVYFCPAWPLSRSESAAHRARAPRRPPPEAARRPPEAARRAPLGLPGARVQGLR